jgi:hypothetical protein
MSRTFFFIVESNLVFFRLIQTPDRDVFLSNASTDSFSFREADCAFLHTSIDTSPFRGRSTLSTSCVTTRRFVSLGLVFYFRVLGVRLYVAFRLFVRMWRRFGFWVYSRRMSESYLNPKRRRMSDRRRMSESYLNPKKRRPCAFFWPTLPTRNDTSSDVSVRSKP